MGLNALIRKRRDTSNLYMKKGQMKSQQEGSGWQAKRGLTRNELSWYLDLELPTPRTVKKKMCIKTPSLRYFVMAAKPDQYIDIENAGVPIVAKR